jgi:hypothetical protein
VLESFLFGVKAKDPLAISLASAILLIPALEAGYEPVWRASRIDPWKARETSSDNGGDGIPMGTNQK